MFVVTGVSKDLSLGQIYVFR